jgi:hypothetical protein
VIRLDREEHKPVDLLKPDASELVATPVNPVVNNPRNDDPRCVEAFEGKGDPNLDLFP